MTTRDDNRCFFCGEYLTHDSYVERYNTLSGKVKKIRHWLSDCRPDLVYHEVGPDCTWHGSQHSEHTCYAYSSGYPHNPDAWGDEHIHFEKDGPMV